MNIMFYSLNAAIWSHALPESRLAKETVNLNHSVTYVSCGKSFPVHCTSMSAVGVGPTDSQKIKEKVCNTCVKNAKTIAKKSSTKHLELNKYISESDTVKVKEAMDTLTKENYLDFTFEGIEVGRIACYEPFLKLKKMSTKLNDKDWREYLVHLENCLISLVGFIKIFDEVRPEKLFIYSPQYGANGVCAEYAIQHSCKVYFIEGSSNNAERYKALRLWDWDVHRLVNPALRFWIDNKQKVRRRDVLRVFDHIKELYHANSFAVFSSQPKGDFSLRQYFKVPLKSKVILASLSSFDEAYSAFIIRAFPEAKVKSSVFADQFEWILRTIEYAKQNPSLFFIIRVHPRDYPNKRESIQSEQSIIWAGLLNNLPGNVAVNSPDDNISIYDLYNQIDLLLTGWSATGVEALLHGVPVVTYDENLPSYPKGIHYSGASVSKYLENIQLALAEGSSDILQVNGFRWLAFNFSLGTIQLNPAIEITGSLTKFHRSLSFIERGLNKIFGQMMRMVDVKVKHGFASEEDKIRFKRFLLENADSLYQVLNEDSGEYMSDEGLRLFLNSRLGVKQQLLKA